MRGKSLQIELWGRKLRIFCAHFVGWGLFCWNGKLKYFWEWVDPWAHLTWQLVASHHPINPQNSNCTISTHKIPHKSAKIL